MKLPALLACIGLMLSSAVAADYESNWQTDYHSVIARVLVKHDIRGCGEFKYKENVEHKREFLVYCTADGMNWTAYQVWVGIDVLEGPFQPSEQYN